VRNSTSHDGIEVVDDPNVKKIRFELQSDDSVTFISGSERYHTVGQVSRHLITELLK
jgi:hypothetical protein